MAKFSHRKNRGFYSAGRSLGINKLMYQTCLLDNTPNKPFSITQLVNLFEVVAEAAIDDLTRMLYELSSQIHLAHQNLKVCKHCGLTSGMHAAHLRFKSKDWPGCDNLFAEDKEASKAFLSILIMKNILKKTGSDQTYEFGKN